MPDGGVVAVAGGKNRVDDGQRARTILGRDGIGQLIKRALLGGQHHRLDVAEGDAFFFADVEDELFQLAGDHRHVAAERIHQFASRVGVDLHSLRDPRFRRSNATPRRSSTRASSTTVQNSPRVSRMRW